MKGLIIYRSRYGATRQYAHWLGEELQLPLRQPEEISSEDIANCDFVIIGSSVYVGKLLIRKWLAKQMPILQNKKIFLFIVCGTPPEEQEKLNVILKNNSQLSLLKQATIYFLHGRMLLKGLHWLDRFGLKLGASLVKDPKVKKEMVTDFDDVRKEHIIPLVKEVEAFVCQEKVLA
ncbi:MULTISPECIES: flavodoxin domain-containing protein [Niastella]|uniref:Flavodoxin domain-containing protein n=1 Tax=Niastella soli TaxID=2821487 RepID=A0ABS3YVH2_9BACT|nr:flavodoxin domain-containing protein [Niastella soli]MBO9201932.1 hypothetical protein [Niastella soli]